MQSNETWFAIHLGRPETANHAGFLRMYRAKDTNSRRVIEQTVSIHGRVDRRAIDHDAVCKLILARRQGRLVPLELEYNGSGTVSNVKFASGRLNATGAAAGANNEPAPDDVMPTFGVFALAGAIYNQPEASMAFTPLTEANGSLGTTGAKLVCNGKVSVTPFPSAMPLWEVVWLNAEGTRVQAFYFDDKGELVQADWGGSRALRVATEAEARPVPKPQRSGRQKKVAG